MTWEYIAGFTDGEGYIGWSEGSPDGNAGRGGKVIIGQKVKEPLERIQDFLRKNGCIKAKIYLRPAREKSENARANAIECWILALQNCHDVRIFLNGVMPHLIVKKGKALFVLDRLKTRTKNFDPVDPIRLTELVNAGYRGHAISAILGITKSKIYLHAKRLGLIWGKGGRTVDGRKLPNLTRSEIKRRYREKAKHSH